MFVIVMLCLSGCTTTRYIDSSIDLETEGVEVDVMAECYEKGCSEDLLNTLVGCEVVSRQQDSRNNVDETVIEDNMAEKIKSSLNAMWSWVF